MSFWNLTDTSENLCTTGKYESTASMEPIPAGTQVKFAADEAKFDEYEGDSFIKIQWKILEGEYKGRIVFQKIRINDSDSKKRDKALRMLAAIAVNCGGGLLKIQQPTDFDLQSLLCFSPMIGFLEVWEVESNETGKLITGNWVRAVSPVNGVGKKPQQQPPQAQQAQQQAPQAQQPQQQPQQAPSFDEDIGF